MSALALLRPVAPTLEQPFLWTIEWKGRVSSEAALKDRFWRSGAFPERILAGHWVKVVGVIDECIVSILGVSAADTLAEFQYPDHRSTSGRIIAKASGGQRYGAVADTMAQTSARQGNRTLFPRHSHLPPAKSESVTHVSGTKCHLGTSKNTAGQTRANQIPFLWRQGLKAGVGDGAEELL